MNKQTKLQAQQKSIEHVVVRRTELAAQDSSQSNNESAPVESLAQTREAGLVSSPTSSVSLAQLDAKHSVNELTISDQMTQLIILFSPMILMVFMFYVLILRPQSKTRQTHIKMIQNLQRGDKIILESGLYGTIHEIHDKYIKIIIGSNELGHNLIVQCAKDAVRKMQQ